MSRLCIGCGGALGESNAGVCAGFTKMLRSWQWEETRRMFLCTCPRSFLRAIERASAGLGTMYRCPVRRRVALLEPARKAQRALERTQRDLDGRSDPPGVRHLPVRCGITDTTGRSPPAACGCPPFAFGFERAAVARALRSLRRRQGRPLLLAVRRRRARAVFSLAGGRVRRRGGRRRR